MRILFLGTPSFAVPSLERVAGEWEVVGVITQPDRPAGRGMRLQPPPVKEKALKLGLEVYQPLNKAEVVRIAESLKPDCAVVVAYGMILPSEFLRIPPLGAINLHASLLPRYRGPDPIRRALLCGERLTGNTVMLINKRMDAGDILSQRELEILDDDNARTLTHRLAREGADLLVETLREWFNGRIKPVPQREEEATYAPPLLREETRICWRAESRSVLNRIRACYPEAHFYLEDRRVKVLRAEVAEGSGEPGEVIDPQAASVACGEGAVRLLEVITPKGRKVKGEDLFRGYRTRKGELLK